MKKLIFVLVVQSLASVSQGMNLADLNRSQSQAFQQVCSERAIQEMLKETVLSRLQSDLEFAQERLNDPRVY